MRLAFVIRRRAAADRSRRSLDRCLPRRRRDSRTAPSSQKIRKRAGVLNARCIVLAKEIGEFAFPSALGQPSRALVADRTTSLEQFSWRFALVQVDGFGLMTGRRQCRALLGASWRASRLRTRFQSQKQGQERANPDLPTPIPQNRAPAAGRRFGHVIPTAQTKPRQGILAA